ncbi:MAG: hypothetical protein Rubg2KO_19620 [Rubricoccaceae bacterium]
MGVVTAAQLRASEVSPMLPVRSLTLAARRAAPLLLLLALSACQDPTGVGLGLIDDDTSQPNARSLAATSAALQSAETTTAGFASSGTPLQTRVLLGSVIDPIYGDATALAYMDVNLPTAGRPENFQDSTITAVALQLRLDDYTRVEGDTALYVYGDPTASLPIEIREITSGWAPTDLAVDATLPVGDIVATGTILPTDTTFTINLDPAWVTANADAIRADDFVTSFEGFEVRIPDGTVAGAVRGIDATLSAMLVATSLDTLRFPVNEVLTSLTQEDAAPSTDVLALRAGRASTLAFDFDFEPVGVAALARADVRFPVERSQTGGTAFVRPLASQALLVGVVSETERIQLSVLTMPSEGDVSTVGGSAFTAEIQDVLIGTRTYDRFEVTLQSNPVSLDLLPLIVNPPADQPGPRFTLTLVGQPVQ